MNDEEDIDIYADLPDGSSDLNKEVNHDVKRLTEQISKLKSDLEALNNTNKILKESNKNLSCNISVLYKTAASEIERKDKVIIDLKRELDNIIFKRKIQKTFRVTTENSSERYLDCQSGGTPLSALVPEVILSEPSKVCDSIDSKDVYQQERKVSTLQEPKSQNTIKEVPKKRKIDYEKLTMDKCTVQSIDTPDQFKQSNSFDNNQSGCGLTKSVFERLGGGYSRVRKKEEDTTEANRDTVLSCTNSQFKANESRRRQQSDQEEEICLKSQSTLDSNKENADSNVSLPKNTPNGGLSENYFQAREDEKTQSSIKFCSLQERISPSVMQDKGYTNAVACDASNCFDSLSASKPPIVEVKSTPVQTFQPPLPEGEPTPLPPLPLTTPPPTPLKNIANSSTEFDKNKFVTKAQSQNSETSVSTGNMLVSEVILQEAESSSVTSKSENSTMKLTVLNKSHDDLYMQCPFKPRRRVKSVVLIEDSAEVNNESALATLRSLIQEGNKDRVATANSSKTTSGSKKSPLKKLDILENKTSTSRTHLTQRPVYSSRCLSTVKSFSHMPERRSPSELLNGRSGRIERLSHHDKIRVRLHDRRSRIVSPQRKNERQEAGGEGYSKRNGHLKASESDCRRVSSRSQVSKGQQSEVKDRKGMTLKNKSVSPSSTEESKLSQTSRLSKRTSRRSEESTFKRQSTSTENQLCGGVTAKVFYKNEASLASSVSHTRLASPSKKVSPQNGIHPELSDAAGSGVLKSPIIFIKRRPRSIINFQNSELSDVTISSCKSSKNELSVSDSVKIFPCITPKAPATQDKVIQLNNSIASKYLDRAPLEEHPSQASGQTSKLPMKEEGSISSVNAGISKKSGSRKRELSRPSLQRSVRRKR